MDIKTIADSILKKSGRWQPELSSNRSTMIILRRDDFKSESMFDYIVEQFGLDSELDKKLKEQDTGDEPVSKISDYDELHAYVSRTKLN